MGVKVSKVKDKKTLKEITTAHCEKGYKGDYICFTTGCNSQMSFVHSYEQRRLEKIIEIPSFFKLRTNEQHSDICPFNTISAVKIIARDSDPNVLKSLEENKYEFSLQILHNPVNNEKNIDNPNDQQLNLPGSNQKNKQYIKNGIASSYIKTLRQILILRAKIEDDKELGTIITLNYKGNKVFWNKFYFNEDCYEEAYQTLKKSSFSYPVCLHGRIATTIPQNDKFKYKKLKLHSPFVELLNEITPIPSIELIIANENDLNNIQNDQEILVYGIINLTDPVLRPAKGKEGKRIEFLNMKIWINHPEQVMLL